MGSATALKSAISSLAVVATVLSLAGCVTPSTGGAGSGSTLVSVESGQLRGAETGNGRSFLGIPYAAPPVGTLRFHAPVPVTGWSGVREATSSGTACAQNGTFGKFSGEEDCLTLNVFAPKSANVQSTLPVMFWIHGGSNKTGNLNGLMPKDPGAVAREYEAVAAKSFYGAAAQVVTDSFFACPTLTFDRLNRKRIDVFSYEFDDPDAPSNIPVAPGHPPLGSYHASEIAYIFHNSWALSDVSKFTPAQWTLARQMQDAWGAFARNGRPGKIGGVDWPQFDGAKPVHLSPISNGLVEDFRMQHHCDFWNARGF